MDPSESQKIRVSGINEHGIWLNQQCYATSLLLTGSRVRRWPVCNLDHLTDVSLLRALRWLKRDCDTFLLGYGQVRSLPPVGLISKMRSHDFLIDVMTTDSAVRLFNVLAEEDRKIGFALIWSAPN